MSQLNTFDARSVLRVAARDYRIWRLDALAKRGLAVSKMPFSSTIVSGLIPVSAVGHAGTQETQSAGCISCERPNQRNKSASPRRNTTGAYVENRSGAMLLFYRISSDFSRR